MQIKKDWLVGGKKRRKKEKMEALGVFSGRKEEISVGAENEKFLSPPFVILKTRLFILPSYWMNTNNHCIPSAYYNLYKVALETGCPSH